MEEDGEGGVEVRKRDLVKLFEWLLELGVGVENEEERNGSVVILEDEAVRWRVGTAKDDDEDADAGRSSKDGGVIPSSVYKKSIWIIVSDSCVRRLLCQPSLAPPKIK